MALIVCDFPCNRLGPLYYEVRMYEREAENISPRAEEARRGRSGYEGTL